MSQKMLSYNQQMKSPELTSGSHCTKLSGETGGQLEPLQHNLNCAIQAVQIAGMYFLAISVINRYFHLTDFEQIPFSSDNFCEVPHLNSYKYENQLIKPTWE